jgi:hypothetical protein
LWFVLLWLLHVVWASNDERWVMLALHRRESSISRLTVVRC